MRTIHSALFIGLLAGGCGGSAPANETITQAVEVQAERLSPFPETLLTTLYLSGAKPLGDNELCDYSGMCDKDAKADLYALIQKGLVVRATPYTYQITGAGVAYVNRHFDIIREGDYTTFKVRRP